MADESAAVVVVAFPGLFNDLSILKNQRALTAAERPGGLRGNLPADAARAAEVESERRNNPAELSLRHPGTGFATVYRARTTRGLSPLFDHFLVRDSLPRIPGIVHVGPQARAGGKHNGRDQNGQFHRRSPGKFEDFE